MTNNTQTVQWIDDPAALRALVDEVITESVYALDTEFHGERTYFPKVALVQLAWRDSIALIDPLAVDIAPLAELLRSDAVLLAHAGDQDLAILERACGCAPTRYFDTQVAAGFGGLGTPSLAALVERILDVQLTKGDRLTDWTKRPLSEAQRAYAAADVEHLVALHDALSERLTESGRLAWATGECDERLARDRSRPEPGTAWWKIKGARQFRGAARGVAQEVAAWREETAQRLDQPTRFVLSDLALAAIAARAPKNAEDLAAVRGLDGRAAKGRVGSEILAAVAAGAALETQSLRLPPSDRADRGIGPAATVVGAWLNQRASELDLEPSLLGTRADLIELLTDQTGRLSLGWRAELVGEPIRRLAAGDAALKLSNGGRRLTLIESNESAGAERAASSGPFIADADR